MRIGRRRDKRAGRFTERSLGDPEAVARLASGLLGDSRAVLTAAELLDQAALRGLLPAELIRDGLAATRLSAALFTHLRANPDSQIATAGTLIPRFYRRDLLRTLDDLQPDEAKIDRENSLVPLLCYFLQARPNNLRVKFIDPGPQKHAMQNAGDLNTNLHADVVAAELPQLDHPDSGFQMPRALLPEPVYFSFELKRELRLSANVWKDFFQAIRNGLWAHESYLVFSRWGHDDPAQKTALIVELERMCRACGLGLIKLDILDPDRSEILFPARRRPGHDHEALLRLAEANRYFQNFLTAIGACLEGARTDDAVFEPIWNRAALMAHLHRHTES